MCWLYDESAEWFIGRELVQYLHRNLKFITVHILGYNLFGWFIILFFFCGESCSGGATFSLQMICHHGAFLT